MAEFTLNTDNYYASLYFKKKFSVKSFFSFTDCFYFYDFIPFF